MSTIRPTIRPPLEVKSPLEVESEAAFTPDELQLSGIVELDMLILANLSLNELQQACATSQYLKRICEDDKFWIIKIKNEYGEEVVALKPAEISWYKAYLGLATFNVNQAARLGRIDVLLVRVGKGIFPDQEGLNWAAQKGHLDVLQCIYSINGMLPDQNAINELSLDGSLNVLQWVYSINGMLPTQDTINNTALEEHLDVLQWVYSINGMLPDQDAINKAVQNGKVDVLQCVYSINGMLPQPYAINWAAQNGKVDVLQLV